ncbi:MAG: AAA-like domain-containing protein [Phormidium tanganyikae FI6-MK23]|jgi:GTPase SAR1 family protein/DNA-binding CsgD family transcriptional regulator|nr:AAA-like domain-containing protein [Phormidium tanganyikae FI6-MK23]
MTLAEFEEKLAQLTPIKRKVLYDFLAGKDDQEIAQIRTLTASTIRRHISKACAIFGFANQFGEHYSYREDLIQLFVRFKPKLVCDRYRHQFTLTVQKLPIQFETPGSPMSINSPFYIQRSRFEPYINKITQPGALLRIRAARKTGKTSLLNRLRAELRNEDYHIVQFRFRDEVSPQTLQDLSKLLHWFCRKINTSLDEEDSIESQDLPTQQENIGLYFQNCVLQKIDRPIVLILDDADCLFEYPATAERFFRMLRGWHEDSSAPDKEIWKKLRMVIAHSTEDYIKFESSPFGNLSIATPLKPLKQEQIQQLVEIYELEDLGSAEISQLYNVVGGNPYFIQQALYTLKHEDQSLDEILEFAPTLQGIYRSHLIEISSRLGSHAELDSALQQLGETEGISLKETEAFKLEGLGVVRFERNRIYWSCELYRRFFRDRFLR